MILGDEWEKVKQKHPAYVWKGLKIWQQWQFFLQMLNHRAIQEQLTIAGWRSHTWKHYCFYNNILISNELILCFSYVWGFEKTKSIKFTLEYFLLVGDSNDILNKSLLFLRKDTTTDDLLWVLYSPSMVEIIIASQRFLLSFSGSVNMSSIIAKETAQM